VASHARHDGDGFQPRNRQVVKPATLRQKTATCFSTRLLGSLPHEDLPKRPQLWAVPAHFFKPGGRFIQLEIGSKPGGFFRPPRPGTGL
jgi:hypothetical protein